MCVSDALLLILIVESTRVLGAVLGGTMQQACVMPPNDLRTTGTLFGYGTRNSRLNHILYLTVLLYFSDLNMLQVHGHGLRIGDEDQDEQVMTVESQYVNNLEDVSQQVNNML